MALENKKSLLQPTSVQAQQFRLQFSNLAPGGVAATSLSNQQPAPVANASPAVSAFVSAPAPVSLAAPPVIPPPPPAPVPATAPAASNVPIEWSKTAIYFNGESIVSSSLENIDLPFNLTSSFGVMMAIKPNIWETGSLQTLLHMYSGSFASQSFTLTLQNNALAATFRNNGASYTQNILIPTNQKEVLGNGYTLITYNLLSATGTTQPLTGANFYVGTSSRSYSTSGNAVAMSASFESADHLYIGGTEFEPGKNFTGNVGFIAFKKPDNPYQAGVFSSRIVQQVASGQTKPKDLINVPGVFRVYTFQEPIGNGFAVETTGSLATKQVPLRLSGSFPSGTNSVSSYFTV